MARRTRDIIASKIHDLGELIARKFFIALPFSPTQLNLMSFFSLAAAAFLFSFGVSKLNWLGLVFIVLGTQFDYADGVVARARGLTNRFGGWFDPFLDLVGQHLIFIGVSLGVLRVFDFNSKVVFLSLFGFWSIALNNFIGIEFNKTFGFDSYVGNNEFSVRFFRLRQKSFWDSFIFNTIMPHSLVYFVLFSIRYFLLLGIFLDRLLWALVLITFFGLLRAGIMVMVYILYLREDRKNKIARILIDLKPSAK